MKTPPRPNIVLLTCHDLGRFLGCYGIDTVRTPNLDRLAARGVRFARSYCVAPQCSPSRAAIATGRYPHANGVMGLSHAGFQWDLHRDERHLAAVLRDAGYQTHQMAVQHETTRIEAMGFDQVHKPWPFDDADAGKRCWRDSRQACAFFEAMAKKKSAANAGAGADSGEHSGADSGGPFYLQIGFFEPHRDPKQPSGFPPTEPDTALGVTVPPYLIDDAEARDEFAHFQGVVHDVDAAVGRMLDTLEATGLLDDTLFIFTADHGVPFPRAKCSLYDPGLEVPLILHWPRGGLSGGVVLDDLIANVDYAPTLCELLGIDPGLRPDRPFQGVSFAGRLLGQTDTPPREAVFAELTYHDYCDPIRAIRTAGHKLMVNFMYTRAYMDPTQQRRPRCTTVVPARHELSRHPLVELYDLHADPNEWTNLADQPEHRPTRDALLARLSTWMHDTADPLIHGLPPSPMHHQALQTLGFDPPTTAG